MASSSVGKFLFLAAVLTASPHLNAIPRGARIPEALKNSLYSTLPAPYDFDSQKTYNVPVVLISFKDTDFKNSNPAEYYTRLFNEKGFNEGAGPGCVADYFRDQSGGRLNLHFDIYGPYKIDKRSGGRENKWDRGDEDIRMALALMFSSVTPDLSKYDWDGDNTIDDFFFVAAGFTGNQVQDHIMPNTGHLDYDMPGGMQLGNASITCERWESGNLCGIGTIVHEFSHALGLPDIYPVVNSSYYSVVDEWDLMDGGNYTNYGWCPPNMTAMERMYLGWMTPEELTEPVGIDSMKPLGAGGKSYIVRSTSNSNEFYIMENRRQEGWDYGCPGNGLLIYHINFDQTRWLNNEVNTSDMFFRYHLFHADNKDYNDWNPESYAGTSKWAEPNKLRSKILSTSPYPYIDSLDVVHDCLTDISTPAAILYKAAADGRKLMGKGITDIQLAEDGTISFTFTNEPMMGFDTTEADGDDENTVWYTIDGRRLGSKPAAQGLYIKSKGSKILLLDF